MDILRTAVSAGYLVDWVYEMRHSWISGITRIPSSFLTRTSSVLLHCHLSVYHGLSLVSFVFLRLALDEITIADGTIETANERMTFQFCWIPVSTLSSEHSFRIFPDSNMDHALYVLEGNVL